MEKEFERLHITVEIIIRDSRIDGIVNFSHAIFHKDVSFLKVRFLQEVVVIGSKFIEDVSFAGSRFDGIVDFSDTQFKSIINLNSEFNKELILDYTDYYKLIIPWGSIENKLKYDDAAFRLLIKNYRKLGLNEMASRSYYRYKIEHRAELVSIFSIIVDTLEKILTDYGTKPIKFFGIAFIIIIGFGLLFSICGAICINSSCSNACGNPPSLSDAFLYSTIVLLQRFLQI